MNKNTLLILFGIFAVLMVIATSSWWGGRLKPDQRASSAADLNLSSFTPTTVDKISISKKGEAEKVLSKEQGIWKINGFDASPKEINGLFGDLKKLNVETLVSKNPENQKNFALNEESGTTISFFPGGANSTVIIGREGSLPDSFYVRKKESSNVYLVSGPLANRISQDVLSWRDKVVAAVPRDAVQKIEIVSPGNSIDIVKKDDKWQAESAGKTRILDDATAGRLFNAINPLEAVDFLTDNEQKEFNKTKDKTSLKVLGNNNQKLFLINLVKKESVWWAQNDGKDTFYKIPSNKLSDIIISLDETSEKNDV
jgi:hypothetical protein